MVSLLILGAVVGWIALWVYVFKHAPNRGVRVGAVVVAILIPLWDLPIGYLEFQRHCEAEGGLRIHESIAPQDKLYFESLAPDSAQELLKQGFKVVEMRRLDGKGVVRHEIQEGNLVSVTVVGPESMVAVSRMNTARLDWNIYREGFVARSLGAKKLLATYTTFSWHGGWLEDAAGSRRSLDCFRYRANPLIALLRQGT